VAPLCAISLIKTGLRAVLTEITAAPLKLQKITKTGRHAVSSKLHEGATCGNGGHVKKHTVDPPRAESGLDQIAAEI